MIVFPIILCGLLVSSPLLAGAASDSEAVRSCETLRVLHLLPESVSGELPGWEGQWEAIEAAGELATQHVNQHQTLLQDFKMELVTIRSRSCTRNDTTNVLIDVVRKTTDLESTCIFAVVGLYCQSMTETLVQFLSHRNFGYIQLSSSISPTFQNTSSYPYLFRVVGSTKGLNSAIVAMMTKSNWTKINLVFDLMPLSVSTASDFVQKIDSAHGLEVRSAISVQDTIQSQSRVTYVTSSADSRASFLCNAAQKGYVWPNFIFILPDTSYSDLLSERSATSCTVDDFTRVLEGQIIVKSRRSSRNSMINLKSGVSLQTYLDELGNRVRLDDREKDVIVWDHANTLYDQVVAAALAMNSSLNEIDINLNGSFVNIISATPHNRNVMAAKMAKLSFQGTSGQINFGITHGTESIEDIFQIKDGKETLIGIYDPSDSNLTGYDDRDIPPDRFATVLSKLPAGLTSVFLAVDTLLFLILCLSGLVMVYWRKEPEVKSTSLPLSLVILTGCLMICLSSLLFTLINATNFSKVASSILCNANSFFFFLGIGLIVVTLMFRLLRIYYFFQYPAAKPKRWKDHHLGLYISLSTSLLVLILVLWMSIHPLRRDSITEFVSSDNPPFTSEQRICFHPHMLIWLALSYSWVVVVLTLLLILAIQTRHVTYKDFKDTKKVTVFIFAVSFVYAICIPLKYILSGTLSTFIVNLLPSLATIVLSLLLIISPKLLPVVRRKVLRISSETYKTGTGTFDHAL